MSKELPAFERRDLDERQQAARALITGHLLSVDDHAFALVRRHAEALRREFSYLCGYDLHITSDHARLFKRLDPDDARELPMPAVTKHECPYPSAARCQRWTGWRFGRGIQHMDGKRARIYARIRKNDLNLGEDDLNRTGRQQQVLQATLGKMVGVGTFFRLPFIGDELVSPLATDLTTPQVFQLGWLRFRASKDSTIYCRLGVTGVGDDNAAVLLMFSDRSAVQPPTPTSGAGCLRGTPLS